MKKKICWITPDYFIDCDIDIIPKLLPFFEINWIVLLPTIGARFKKENFQSLQRLDGLTIEFVYSQYRQRDARRIAFYVQLYHKIKSVSPDLVYLNYGTTPFSSVLTSLLNKKNTIITAHQGAVHKGFRFPQLVKLMRSLYYRKVKYVNMFSPSQALLFKNDYPDTHIFTILLGLKDFGASTVKKKDPIQFLSFGIISYGKHIDLLIDAACAVYEKGIRNFKIKIAGACSNWEFYQNKIKYPEIFDTDIRLIDNKEIPDLFSESHYFVQPYRIVTQSGPLKIAFNYTTPVIVSDLSGFTDEVQHGVNGFVFKKNDVHALENLLLQLIENHNTIYPALIEGMKTYTTNHYSPEVITNSYLDMFNYVIKNK